MEVTRVDLETIVYGVQKEGEVKFTGLKYVRVEPGMLVATDGHVLIVREVPHDSDDQFEPFCISVADIKAAIKANAELWKTNGNFVKIDPGNDFMARIGRKSVAKQETSYPEWARVLKGARKETQGHQMAHFSPTVLMKALQGMRDSGVVELRIWKPDKAVRLDGMTEDGRKIMALAMPTIDK
jgi:hypothetical protein